MPHDDRDLTRAARRRMRRTGEGYEAALAAIRDGRRRLARLRYVLTADVRRLMRGEGRCRVALGTGDARGGDRHAATVDDGEGVGCWLAGLPPVYRCRVCGGAGDARAEDTGLRLAVAPDDPDLSPGVATITTLRHHARCAPSEVIRSDAAGVPRGPFGVSLPADAAPESTGEFAVVAQPVTVPAGLGLMAGAEPALLVTAEVTEHLGAGPTAWLWQFELSVWRPAGFREPSFAERAGPGWSVRVVPGRPGGAVPGWVAVRRSEPAAGRAPDHLYLGAVDVPGGWAEAVRGRDALLLLAGPIATHGDAPRIPSRVGPDRLAELLGDGTLLAAYAPLVHDAPR
ncbi:hypothetical protein [Sphaerisporangium corydalis]